MTRAAPKQRQVKHALRKVINPELLIVTAALILLTMRIS